MFYFFHAERADSLGTENEVGNLHQMADEGEQSLLAREMVLSRRIEVEMLV